MLNRNAVLIIADEKQFPPAVFLARRMAALNQGEAGTVLLATDWEPGLTIDAGTGVELLDVRGLMAEVSLPLAEYFTRATYFTLFLPNLLRERFDRVVYLDTDTYPESRRVFDLFRLDLGGRAIGGVRDLVVGFWPNPHNSAELSDTLRMPPKLGAKYLNTGVMMIDLAAWHSKRLEEKALKVLHDRRIQLRYADQSVLNAILLMDWRELSPTFNMITRAWASFIRGVFPPAVVHFTGPIKPWHASFVDDHPAREEVRAFLRSSPWPNYLAEMDANTSIGARPERQMPIWRDESLRALIRHLRETPFADVEQGVTKPDWSALPP